MDDAKQDYSNRWTRGARYVFAARALGETESQGSAASDMETGYSQFENTNADDLASSGSWSQQSSRAIDQRFDSNRRQPQPRPTAQDL